MFKLAHPLLLLCIVATLAHAVPTQLTPNQAINGTVNSTHTFADYSFSHTQSVNPSYQVLRVLTFTTQSVDVLVSNGTGSTMLTCAASASLPPLNYAAICQYSFNPCVSVPSPEQYNVNITYPTGASSAFEFQVADIQVDSSLSENTNIKNDLTTCCGYQGGSWHYIQPSPFTIITNVTLTLTAGSFTPTVSPSSGLGSILPGVYVLPATVCTSANIADFAKVLNETRTSAFFGLDFTFGSGGLSVKTTVTVELDVSENNVNVGYWVYVIADQSSAGVYSLAVEYQSTGSGSRLVPFSFWSGATDFNLL